MQVCATECALNEKCEELRRVINEEQRRIVSELDSFRQSTEQEIARKRQELEQCLMTGDSLMSRLSGLTDKRFSDTNILSLTTEMVKMVDAELMTQHGLLSGTTNNKMKVAFKSFVTANIGSSGCELIGQLIITPCTLSKGRCLL